MVRVIKRKIKVISSLTMQSNDQEFKAIKVVSVFKTVMGTQCKETLS
jgi:hypothetical protein